MGQDGFGEELEQESHCPKWVLSTCCRAEEEKTSQEDLGPLFRCGRWLEGTSVGKGQRPQCEARSKAREKNLEPKPGLDIAFCSSVCAATVP